jgi:MFS family permease
VFIFGVAVFAFASFAGRRGPGRLVADRRPRLAGHRRGGRGTVVAVAADRELPARAAPRRAKAVARYGATAGTGASLGLVIGGALAGWVSWRAGFFLNVPIGLAMIVLAPRYLPETARRPGRFDLTGAVCATLGVGALVFAVIVLLAFCLIATLVLILPSELAGRHRDTRRSGRPARPERVLAAARTD